MGTISVRVPDALEKGLDSYSEAEQCDRSTALRELLSMGLRSWRTDRALTLLGDGEVTVSRAAKMADRSVWEVANLAKKRDIDWVGAEHLLSDLEAVD